MKNLLQPVVFSAFSVAMQHHLRIMRRPHHARPDSFTAAMTGIVCGSTRTVAQPCRVLRL
jgi:hypothetical protein